MMFNKRIIISQSLEKKTKYAVFFVEFSTLLFPTEELKVDLVFSSLVRIGFGFEKANA